MNKMLKAIVILISLASIPAWADTITSVGKDVFMIGNDHMIYHRTTSSNWELYSGQLPAGSKAIAIVGVMTEASKAYDGFNAGQTENLPTLIAIADDGSNYVGYISQGTLNKSKASLPNGIKPLVQSK